MEMKRELRVLAATGGLLLALSTIHPALAQKPGGVLRVHALDSPPSMSMHEEVDAVPARAMMGVFNNLVMFDQHAKQNSLQSIVPDLATGWSWSEDGTQLTFPLRKGVKWHDGKPFTAQDVKCTWDLLTGKWNYGCGSPRNYTGYCNPELERLFDRQSTEGDDVRRKKLVWEIEKSWRKTVRGRSSFTIASPTAGTLWSRVGR
jgi:ABC-type transport system substrate-binding protein